MSLDRLLNISVDHAHVDAKCGIYCLNVKSEGDECELNQPVGFRNLLLNADQLSALTSTCVRARQLANVQS